MWCAGSPPECTAGPRGRLAGLALAGAAVLAASSAAPCKAQTERTSAARRIVRTWDFEERERHGQDVPQHWRRAQARLAPSPEASAADLDRPGFPPWNRAGLSSEQARSGRWSAELPTQGGSTALRLDHRTLPVLPSNDHAATCWVRTAGLTHARARLVATLYDADGEPLATAASAPVIAESAWVEVGASLRGHPGAVSVGLELQLLQPAQLADGSGPVQADGSAWPQDLAGRAWFDDLSLRQTPRIAVGVASGWPVVEGDEPPAIELRVRDASGERLSARLEVRDETGRLIDSARASPSADWTPEVWRPSLPRFGWYGLTATVTDRSGEVGARAASFVWAPTAARSPAQAAKAEGPHFGVVLTGLDAGWSHHAARLAHASHASWINAPIGWGLDDDAGREALAALVDELLKRGHDVGLIIDRPGRTPTGEEDRVAVLREWLASPDAEHLGLLTSILARYGERIDRWRIGPRPAPGISSPEADALTASALAMLRVAAPRPRTTLAWFAWRTPPGWASPDREVIPVVEAWIPADAVGDYLRAWTGAAGRPAAAVMLDALDDTRYTDEWVAIDLARRAVEAWAAGAPVVAIDMPWRVGRDITGARPTPAPTLAGWRSVAAELAGVAPLGAYPAGRGVRAFVGRRADGEGVLVAWNAEQAPAGDALDAYLGAGPFRVTDLFGNELTPIVDERGRLIAPLGRGPVFIRGVDPELAMFRAGLRLEPAELGVRAARQPVDLVVQNPWDAAARVTFRFTRPEAWDVSPRVSTLTLPPGGETRSPLEMLVGLAETGGEREVALEIDVESPKSYAPFEAFLTARLRLPGLRAHTVYWLEDEDLVLEVSVANVGRGAVGLDVLAHAPGRSVQETPIAALGLGERRVLRFGFEDGASLLGETARVSIRERDGAGRLNLEIELR